MSACLRYLRSLRCTFCCNIVMVAFYLFTAALTAAVSTAGDYVTGPGSASVASRAGGQCDARSDRVPMLGYGFGPDRCERPAYWRACLAVSSAVPSTLITFLPQDLSK
ncbi:hypothetical protein MRX96_011455 [Rhipicephalus microplus]